LLSIYFSYLNAQQYILTRFFAFTAKKLPFIWNFMTETTKRGIRWEGTSPSGVKIEGILNKKGTRAFPMYKGGN